MNEYVFENGKFQAVTIEEFKACPNGADWNVFLASIGWKRRSHFPEHKHWEFAYIVAEIYEHQERRSYMVDIACDQETIMYVICPTGLDLMLLHRDYLIPLCRAGDGDFIVDGVIEATHCLLDEEHGLPCAQRVKAHDRRVDEYYKREMKKKAAPQTS